MHTKVEDNNTLGWDTIRYSKYIKPPPLHTDNQRVAHVILSFTDQDNANTAIASGLFIEGKHMNVHKSLTEPKRCLKCQRYGHYATECKATTDVIEVCEPKEQLHLFLGLGHRPFCNSCDFNQIHCD